MILLLTSLGDVLLENDEGLLFSSVAAIDEVLLPYAASHLRDLEDIRNQYNTPEEIDDGVNTAPSKRLITLYANYDKVTFGVRIAERIGLDRIRQECPHFSQWLAQLESLRGPQP